MTFNSVQNDLKEHSLDSNHKMEEEIHKEDNSKPTFASNMDTEDEDEVEHHEPPHKKGERKAFLKHGDSAKHQRYHHHRRKHSKSYRENERKTSRHEVDNNCPSYKSLRRHHRHDNDNQCYQYTNLKRIRRGSEKASRSLSPPRRQLTPGGSIRGHPALLGIKENKMTVEYDIKYNQDTPKYDGNRCDISDSSIKEENGKGVVNVEPLKSISDFERTKYEYDEDFKKKEPKVECKIKEEAKYGQKAETIESHVEWGKTGAETNRSTDPDSVEQIPVRKERPDFEASGLLANETNVKNGVLLKHTIPLDGRMPTKRWRLYMFKGEEQTKVLHLHRSQCFLIGKDRRVADILLLHPTVSKQHAVIQFRLRNGNETCPYLIDLDSCNGSFVNNHKIESRRYYELREKDVLRFGRSSRELILLHTLSTNDSI